MSDLKIDYQSLSYTHAALSQLAAWFDTAQQGQAAYNADFGSSAVANAVGNVMGNWTYHRKQLVQKMQDLDAMVTAALTEFPRTDDSLAKELG
jgi:hypothetical protein